MDSLTFWFSAVIAVLTFIASWLTEQQKKRINQMVVRGLGTFFGHYFIKILWGVLYVLYTAIPVIMTAEVLINGTNPTWREIIAYVFILFVYSFAIFRLTVYQKLINEINQLKAKISDFEKRLSVFEKFQIEETTGKIQKANLK